jgi:hypothetical protein
VSAEDAEATDLRRRFSKEQTDIRDDIRVTEEVLAFNTEAGAKSVVMTNRIIGCPMKKASVTRGHLSGLSVLGGTGPLDRQAPALGISAGLPAPRSERPQLPIYSR